MTAYSRATVVTPNVLQAGAGFGKRIVDEEALREAGRGLQNRLGCDAVLITQGEKGMTLFESSGKESSFPAMAKKVYDVTGAGDTVVSVVGVALTAGASLAEAAFMSNHAAGIVVGELGTASVTRVDLIASLDAEAAKC